MKQAFSSEKELGEFTFLRIPKAIMSPIYKGVSIMSKFVYGLLMERLGLSIKNEWKDVRGTFIYFTVLELSDTIGCSRNKTIKLLTELEDANLILRIKTGQGKPAKIYVLKPVEYRVTNKKQTETSDKTTAGFNEETENEHNCESKNTYRDVPNTTPEVENLNFLKLKSVTSKSLKPQLQEVHGFNPNNTEYNNTEWNNTEKSNTENNKKRETEFSAESINPSNILQKFNFENKDDGLDRWNLKYQQIVCNIKKQVDYDTLTGSNDKAVIDNIVNIMAEVMMLNKPYYEISGERIPSSLVKIRFGQITYQKLESFLIDFGKICYRIKNPKAYLISALYNLSMTADASLANRVNYDMANLDFNKKAKSTGERYTQNWFEEREKDTGERYTQNWFEEREKERERKREKERKKGLEREREKEEENERKNRERESGDIYARLMYM